MTRADSSRRAVAALPPRRSRPGTTDRSDPVAAVHVYRLTRRSTAYTAQNAEPDAENAGRKTAARNRDRQFSRYERARPGALRRPASGSRPASRESAGVESRRPTGALGCARLGAARSHDRARVPDGVRVRQAEHAAQPERDRSDSSARLPSPRFGCLESPLAF